MQIFRKILHRYFVKNLLKTGRKLTKVVLKYGLVLSCPESIYVHFIYEFFALEISLVSSLIHTTILMKYMQGVGLIKSYM